MRWRAEIATITTIIVRDNTEDTNQEKIKTYQVYIKKNYETGEVYVGRTSGYNDPEINVINRDYSHHKN